MSNLFQSNEAKLILASEEFNSSTCKKAILAEAQSIMRERERLQLSLLQNYSAAKMLG